MDTGLTSVDYPNGIFARIFLNNSVDINELQDQFLHRDKRSRYTYEL